MKSLIYSTFSWTDGLEPKLSEHTSSLCHPLNWRAPSMMDKLLEGSWRLMKSRRARQADCHKFPFSLYFTLFYITLYRIQRRGILITVSVTYFNRGNLYSSHTSPPSDLLIIRLDTSVIPWGSWINQGDTPHHTRVVSWSLDASAWALDSRDYCHWSSSWYEHTLSQLFHLDT